MYNEIFIKKIYEFKSSTDSPKILDVGSNIGLSILFFKEQYPNCSIIGFEADPHIYEYLKFNTQGINDLELVRKAVFDKETELNFCSDNSDGGSLFQESQTSIKVKTCLLSCYLKEPIDFLKVDIEGAETIVLRECREKLFNVKNLFVEYHSFNDNRQSLHELLQIISEAGFRYYISGIEHCSSNPFMKKTLNNNMDLQLNISCVRD